MKHSFGGTGTSTHAEAENIRNWVGALCAVYRLLIRGSDEPGSTFANPITLGFDRFRWDANGDWGRFDRCTVVLPEVLVPDGAQGERLEVYSAALLFSGDIKKMLAAKRQINEKRPETRPVRDADACTLPIEFRYAPSRVRYLSDRFLTHGFPVNSA
jgi:hypothetical protein